jgi:large subunit ribosomal protein L17
MHRHGYKGRKLHRDDGQRTALLRGLAISLFEHHAIETTLPKAKELMPFAEVLITKAKRGDLHSRRQVISAIDNIASANNLVDHIAPQLTGRTSGHLRIVRTRLRVGDNAQMAEISFVDDINDAVQPKAVAPAAKKEAK